MNAITEVVARKVRDTVAQGLVGGMGSPVPGKMCVEAAVCYALGLPHGDDPGCVAQSLRRLKIQLNDLKWSSPVTRAEGLKRLALIQLGSAGVLDESEFTRRVIEMTIRRVVPVALRTAAKLNPKHAVPLEAAAVHCEVEGTRKAARDAERVASAAAARVAATYTAYTAAASAAYAADAAAAGRAAGRAATADAAACYAASTAAASAATADAAYATAASDQLLSDYAEWVVEILIDMQVPGVQWLHLLNEK